jgi:hypothetical protein
MDRTENDKIRGINRQIYKQQAFYFFQTKECRLKMDVGEAGWVVWTELIWLRIGTSEELL